METKLNFTLNLTDCNNYVHSQFRIPRARLYILKEGALIVIIASIVLAVIFCLLGIITSFLSLLLYFLLFSVFYALIRLLSVYCMSGKAIYNYLDGLENIQLSISEQEIVCVRKKITTTFHWENIEDVYDLNGNYLIFITLRQALIIPKRIFENEYEAIKFWGLINDYYKRAKNNNL